MVWVVREKYWFSSRSRVVCKGKPVAVDALIVLPEQEII